MDPCGLISNKDDDDDDSQLQFFRGPVNTSDAETACIFT